MPRTLEHQRALAALATFIGAAKQLNLQWSTALEHGYPSRLPSFDEFIHELLEWHERAESGPVEIAFTIKVQDHYAAAYAEDMASDINQLLRDGYPSQYMPTFGVNAAVVSDDVDRT